MMGLFHPKKRAIVTMKNIGDKSEACIIAKLMQVGYAVLIPFNARRGGVRNPIAKARGLRNG
jgi:hypothetical protein